MTGEDLVEYSEQIALARYVDEAVCEFANLCRASLAMTVQVTLGTRETGRGLTGFGGGHTISEVVVLHGELAVP